MKRLLIQIEIQCETDETAVPTDLEAIVMAALRVPTVENLCPQSFRVETRLEDETAVMS